MVTKTQLRDTVARLVRAGYNLSVNYAYGKPRIHTADEARDLSPRLPAGQIAHWLDGFEHGAAQGYERGVRLGREAESRDTEARRRRQGFRNFETYSLDLEMKNARENVELWREAAQSAFADAVADGTFTRYERARLDLCATIKDYFEERAPELDSPFGELLAGALSEVDWYELAGEWLEEHEAAE
jgi:hypothetical protein